MAAPDGRIRERDVFVSNSRDPEAILAGLVLTPGITNQNLHQMLEIVLVIPGFYHIQGGNGEELSRDTQPLLPGNYLVVTDEHVRVSDEAVLTRAVSRDGSTRMEAFREAVRRRDSIGVVSSPR